MRFIVAIGLTLALGSLIATPGAAQTDAKGGLTQSFNSCVDLARQRGWTESDLQDNRAAARNFVIRCMQGGKARAQKQKTKKAQKTQR
jgi:hypothetical protein